MANLYCTSDIFLTVPNILFLQFASSASLFVLSVGKVHLLKLSAVTKPKPCLAIVCLIQDEFYMLRKTFSFIFQFPVKTPHADYGM